MIRTTRRVLLIWLALLPGAALAQAPAGVDVVTLQDGRAISAPILKETSETLWLDMGFTVVQVPRTQVLSIVRAKPDEAPTDASKGDMFRVASGMPERAPKELARTFGGAVIMVSTPSGLGSGFIIHPDGYAITNAHVVQGETKIKCTVFEQGELDFRRNVIEDVEIVAVNNHVDLALIKMQSPDAKPFPTVYVQGAEDLAAGQDVFAIGSPLGLERTLSRGVIATTQRNFEGMTYIQTTAEINPGNSGGPLFDLNGEVIGVNTAVILPQKSTNGIGFAVPITPQLIGNVRQLREGREVVYAYLGVTVSTLTEKARKSLGLSDIAGARIDSIEKDSPADASPLRLGDVVVELNGELVRDGDHFIRLVGFASVDRPNRMSLYRDGKPHSVEVLMRKRQMPSVAVTRRSQRIHWRGMLLGPVPEHWTEGAKAPGGGLMVLAIQDDSPMLEYGMKVGSIIDTVAGQAIGNIAQLQRIINDVDPSQWTITLSDHPDLAQGQVVAVE